MTQDRWLMGNPIVAALLFGLVLSGMFVVCAKAMALAGGEEAKAPELLEYTVTGLVTIKAKRVEGDTIINSTLSLKEGSRFYVRADDMVGQEIAVRAAP